MSNVDNGQELVNLLGHDPAKEPNFDNDALQEIMSELAVERKLKAKEKAREVIVKASELRKKMVSAEREFNKQKQAFDKELGKLMGSLRSALNGTAPVTEETAPVADPAPQT